MSKKGTTNLLKGQIRKALLDERLTANLRREYIWMLAELDGYVFKFKESKSPDELPTEAEIFARDSQKRIRELLGGEETHANTASK